MRAGEPAGRLEAETSHFRGMLTRRELGGRVRAVIVPCHLPGGIRDGQSSQASYSAPAAGCETAGQRAPVLLDPEAMSPTAVLKDTG